MLRKIFAATSVAITVALTFILRIHLPKLFFMPILIFIGSYFGLIILFFLFDFITSLFIDMKKDYTTQSKFNHALVILTIELLNDLAHVKVVKKGFEKIPHDERYLLIFNHTSKFDPMVLTDELRKDKVIQITKPENIKIPIAGKHIYRDCYIPIDRDNDREALKAILKSCKFLKENKYSVCISPEGTRNKGDVNKLLPFKDGSFKAALKGEKGIVVCGLRNFSKIHKNFPFKRTVVEVNCLAYLPYESIKSLKTCEIADMTSKMIQDYLDKNPQ